jgi:short-subunit dehydrogenase
MITASKLAVITGGTKGIGKAIVEKLAHQGFAIFTCARNQKDLEGLQFYIENKYGVKLYYEVADLSKKEDCKRFTKSVLNVQAPIEILVNNTGYFVPGFIHQEEDGILEQMIETNLYSTYFVTKGIVQRMIEQKSGHIFNMCSTASITAYTNGGSYCIAKFAQYGLTKVLREELKVHNVRVTAILPGATYTSSWEGANVTPERLMKPEDVAEALWGCYQLSEQSVVEEILIRPQLGDL